MKENAKVFQKGNHTCRVAFPKSRENLGNGSTEKSGAKRHAAVVQRVTWSHRAKFAAKLYRKSVVRSDAREGAGEWRGRVARMRRATHRVGPHLRVQIGLLRHLRVVRRGLLSVRRARGRLGVRAGVVRLHGSRCRPLRVVRGVRGGEIAGARRGAVRGRGHAGHGCGLGLRQLRRAFRGDGHGGAWAGPRARVTRMRGRKELSAATRSREATARDVRGLGGDARAREEPTGKREPDGGGRRVRSSAPTDWHSRAFASREVAEYDVSRRPSMTRRFQSAFPLTTWHRPEFKSSMQSPMKTRFSKATALCEAHDPKSHAPGVSSRPRHRAHRRAGKTHERSKGESSDMPPRGMSAEVRALSSAPLRRGAQIREMRSETRATRGG